MGILNEVKCDGKRVLIGLYLGAILITIYEDNGSKSRWPVIYVGF